jgi:hypothetical protein
MDFKSKKGFAIVIEKAIEPKSRKVAKKIGIKAGVLAVYFILLGFRIIRQAVQNRYTDSMNYNLKKAVSGF